jgi:CHASE2 domain-containing sensor protein
VDILLSFVPWKFELIKPIKEGFNDFSVYDLRYSGMDTLTTTKDTGITLLEIGNNRQEIAAELDRIAPWHPRIVAIDGVFNNPGDPAVPGSRAADSSLIAAARHIPHLVLASQYKAARSGDSTKEWIGTGFLQSGVPGAKDGFYNFVEDVTEIKRHCFPFLTINGRRYPSMAAAMLEQLDSGAYQRLLDRDTKLEVINYAGDIQHYNTVTLERILHPLKDEDLSQYFRDKIVFVGFFRTDPPDVLEDMHFTPMNSQRGGKSFPDTYGVVIHANILGMMLGGRYIHVPAVWAVYAGTFVIIFFINILYIRRLARSRQHNHIILFLLQFALAIGLLYLALLIFDWFNVELDLMPLLIAVVLSFEIFWLYEWLAVKMNKQFGYATFLHD